MSIRIARTAEAWWRVDADQATPLPIQADTTAGLIEALPQVAGADGPKTPVADLDLQSPVTAPCRVIAQMVNYRSHARDSGFDPAEVQATFFRKASASITGPQSQIPRPAHVRLLDYEVELGLVMKSPLAVGTTVTPEDLPELVFGLVVANDISARDVQLTKTQFYESKSYPGFTPVGPYLQVLDRDDWRQFNNLRLTLSVNGQLRQDQTVNDMIVAPAEALTALARFQPLEAGDLLLTGTPGGTALKAPPKAVEKIAALLPPHVKWKIFFDKQEKVQTYLQPGDQVSAGIATGDRTLDLGTQHCVVVGAR